MLSQRVSGLSAVDTINHALVTEVIVDDGRARGLGEAVLWHGPVLELDEGPVLPHGLGSRFFHRHRRPRCLAVPQSSGLFIQVQHRAGTLEKSLGILDVLPRMELPGADLLGVEQFDPGQRAFYYVRVIEIPTPRWTAFDAKRLGVKMPPEVPMFGQERAYTSPIWYTPKS